MTIQATLDERGTRYGDFSDHAVIAQNLQNIMRATEGWAKLSPVQAQALTVIADKIARVLNGDPNYADNWHDIQGYAKLVEDRLPQNNAHLISHQESVIKGVLQAKFDKVPGPRWVAKVVKIAASTTDRTSVHVMAECPQERLGRSTTVEMQEGERYEDIANRIIDAFRDEAKPITNDA